MTILFIVCLMVVFVAVPFFAIKIAYKKDYPNRELVQKAIAERKADREKQRRLK